MVESPLRTHWHAISNAMILLEHAESKLRHDPVRSKNQLIRLANIIETTPVDECLEAVSIFFELAS